jgi:hypothetical protein
MKMEVMFIISRNIFQNTAISNIIGTVYRDVISICPGYAKRAMNSQKP